MGANTRRKRAQVLHVHVRLCPSGGGRSQVRVVLAMAREGPEGGYWAACCPDVEQRCADVGGTRTRPSSTARMWAPARLALDLCRTYTVLRALPLHDLALGLSMLYSTTVSTLRSAPTNYRTSRPTTGYILDASVTRHGHHHHRCRAYFCAPTSPRRALKHSIARRASRRCEINRGHSARGSGEGGPAVRVYQR